MTNAAYRRTQLEALVEAQGGCRATPPLLLRADPYFDLAGEEFGRRLLLTTDASDTAQPFFARRGFVAMQRNTVIRDGQWLGNTTMQKRLDAPQPAGKPS